MIGKAIGTGVGKIADHRTIGPRKYLRSAERKREDESKCFHEKKLSHLPGSPYPAKGGDLLKDTHAGGVKSTPYHVSGLVFLFSCPQNPSINHLNFYCIKQIDYIFPCVYCNRSQKTLQRVKNNSLATRLFFFTHCDTEKCYLFVKYTMSSLPDCIRCCLTYSRIFSNLSSLSKSKSRKEQKELVWLG